MHSCLLCQEFSLTDRGKKTGEEKKNRDEFEIKFLDFNNPSPTGWENCEEMLVRYKTVRRYGWCLRLPGHLAL